jgi:membrane protease subunit HflK
MVRNGWRGEMTQDTRTYERAVAGALLGMAIQVVVGLVLLALALWTRHPAVIAAAWHAAGGLPVWVCLVLVFQQHRLERAEALEAERLAKQPGTEGRLFEQSAADLSVARRRLGQLQRWGVPLAGLLSALYLLVVGAWLAQRVRGLFEEQAARLTDVPDPLVILAVTAGLTFAGFVASRYLAGMARYDEWRLLRGGAGYLMGSVMLCGLLALSAATKDLGSGALLKYLAIAAPLLMMALAVEIALNLVLDIYRPRKPGEFARPAFDSRLLGLLTAPESIALTIQEAVNYQFGFEITRSWFWKLLARAVLPLAGVGVLLLLLLSCVVVVPPHQQALVTRFGSLARSEPLKPGLHLKLPWPFEAARAYDVTRIREFRIGACESDEASPADAHDHGDEHADEHGQAAKKEDHASEAVLWAKQHGHKEESWLTATPKTAGEAPGGAVSLVNAYIPVQWRIKEDGLLDYAQTHDLRKPFDDSRLQDLAEAQITRYFLSCDVDQLLGPRRGEAGALLRRRLQEDADREKLGIEVVFVGMSGLHPPAEGEVATKFHEPVIARQEAAIALEEARIQRIKALTEATGSVEQAERILAGIQALRAPELKPEELARREEALLALLQTAGGQVARKIAEARAFRWTYENGARAEAERFSKELLAQVQSPHVYRMRRYLEVLAEGLADARKYLLIADRDHLTIRLDLKDTETEVPQLDLKGAAPPGK